MGRAVATLLLALALLGCSTGSGREGPARKQVQGRGTDARGAGEPARSGRVVEVVATTSVVADLVRLVGSTNVRTHTVVKAGLDPLTYRLTTADREQAARAVLVLGVGRGLEPWLRDLGGPRTVLLSDGLPGRRTASGGEDPFVWQDADNGKAMVGSIARALTEVDPIDGPAFAFAASATAAKVDRADADARRLLSPLAGRAFVTTKETMGWFAARYGLVVAGSVIPSTDGSAEIGTQHLTELKAAVRDRQVVAVFGEVSVAAGPALALARETGVAAVTGADALCGDGLGAAGTPADTYVGCLTHNARELAAHL